MTDVGRGARRTASSRASPVGSYSGDDRRPAQDRVRRSRRCSRGATAGARSSSARPAARGGSSCGSAARRRSSCASGRPASGGPVVPEECRIEDGVLRRVAEARAWSGSRFGGGAGRSSATSAPAQVLEHPRVLAPELAQPAAVGVDADGRRLAAQRGRERARRAAVDHHADRADLRQREVVHGVGERVVEVDRDAVARLDPLHRGTTTTSSGRARRGRAG